MTRVHLICRAEDVGAAEAALGRLWGSDQTGAFAAPLGGAGVATHRGCSGDYLASQLEGLRAEAVWRSGEEGDFWEFARSLGLVPAFPG